MSAREIRVERPTEMRRDRITIRKVPADAALQWRWRLPVWTGSYYEGWAFSQSAALEAALRFLAQPDVQGLVPR